MRCVQRIHAVFFSYFFKIPHKVRSYSICLSHSPSRMLQMAGVLSFFFVSNILLYVYTCVCVCVFIYVYIWASLVAQIVKNLPAVQETRV